MTRNLETWFIFPFLFLGRARALSISFPIYLPLFLSLCLTCTLYLYLYLPLACSLSFSLALSLYIYISLFFFSLSPKIRHSLNCCVKVTGCLSVYTSKDISREEYFVYLFLGGFLNPSRENSPRKKFPTPKMMILT